MRRAIRIPFRLHDRPENEAEEAPRFNDIGVQAVGHITSPRGVELIAIKGKHDETAFHDMTSIGWVFHAYLTRPKATLRIDAGPQMPMPRFVFLPPDVPIRWRSAPSINTVCLFGADFVERLLDSEAGVGFGALNCITTTKSDRLAHISQKMFREAVSPGFGAGLLAEALATEIALELIRCDRSHRPDDAPLRGGLPPWQMRRLESYVHAHLSGDLSLQSLADVVGISARHLSRVVKHETGVGVHHWIADLRLDETRRLLVETDLPLHEIARRAAFKNPATFSSAFRAATGSSPSEFRKMVRE